MQLFSTARTRRVNFEVQWEESAALCWPEYRNSFAFGHTRAPGQKYTEFQVDSTGSIASHRFMAIADAFLTPHNQPWKMIRANDPYVMKQKGVRDYFDAVSATLWYETYRAESNFIAQNQQNFQILGVFGNPCMYVDELETKPGRSQPGLRYVSCGPGEIYKLKNYQGRTDGVIRHFRWTARQAYQKWGDKIPQLYKAALEKNDNYTLWDFLQFVIPASDYDPMKIFSPQGKAYASVYVSVAGYCILERGGYRTMPFACDEYMLAPEEEYGRGPAQMCLPDLKTMNSEAAMYLRVGHRNADPAYLIADDGIVDLKTDPRAFNFGGMSPDGARLVAPLEVGKLEDLEMMLARSDKKVQDAFLTSFFPLLQAQAEASGGQKPFRQVIEEAAQRGLFLGPTLGRMFGGYLPTMVDREIDILSNQRKFPKMPDALKEAKGEYQLKYTGPLARDLEGVEDAGFMGMVEMLGSFAQQTGDTSHFDRLDFDTAIPEMAEHKYVPNRWVADDKAVAAKRKQRADAQERENQVKELPGRAAIIKAQAIGQKAQAGQNTGGTLSGTPTGGMPMLPGQAAPGGRAFGQPGQQ